MLRMTSKLIGKVDAAYEEGITTGQEREESSGKRRRLSQRDGGDLQSEVGSLSSGLERLGSASEARTKPLRYQIMYERSSKVDENNQNMILKTTLKPKPDDGTSGTECHGILASAEDEQPSFY